MVKAWMDGRKTVTRRLIGNPRPDCVWCRGFGYEYIEIEGELGMSGYDYRQPCRCIKPRYLPGETVYIKETWAKHPTAIELGHPIVFYKQRGDTILPDNRWKSPRFMPEWAARSHALIVSVRPEQLRGMTGIEALLEGFETLDDFMDCWAKLHGEYDYQAWVWRIELERKP